MFYIPLRSSFGKISNCLISVLIFIFSGTNVNAQNNFSEGVIIFKVDSVISDRPKDSIDITVSKIRLFKKNNLGRSEIIKVEPRNGNTVYTETEVINEKGKYFIIDPQLGPLVKKHAVLLTFDDIKEGRAEFAFKGKIREFAFKRSLQKDSLLKILVEKMYRIEKQTNKTLELAVARDINTSFGFFFPDYLKLDGTPFQFYYEENNILYHLSAESITKKALDNDLFTIGSEYDIFPLETVLSSFKKN